MRVNSQFGILGLQGKKLGFWDYTPFEFGITEIRFEFGITGFHLVPIWDYSSIHNWDYGITLHLKFGFQDYTTFEIGILGLLDPTLTGPYNSECWCQPKWAGVGRPAGALESMVVVERQANLALI